MTDEFVYQHPYEPSVRLRVPAVYPAPEHKGLRDAVDAANVEGTVTWIKNTAGAPVAAIVPRGVAELGLREWEKINGS